MTAMPFRPDPDCPVLVHRGPGLVHVTHPCGDEDVGAGGARMLQPVPLRHATEAACPRCGSVLTALHDVLDAPRGGAVAIGVTVDDRLLLNADTRLVWSVLRAPLVGADATGWRFPATPAPWVVLVDTATASWVQAHTGLSAVALTHVPPATFARTAAVLWDPDTGADGLGEALQAAAALHAGPDVSGGRPPTSTGTGR